MKEPDEYARAVGARIKTARLEMEGGPPTQKELADLLGVSERSMSAYETGEVVPYFKMVDLSQIVNRPVAWILHGDQARESPGDLAPILDRISGQLDQILRKL